MSNELTTWTPPEAKTTGAVVKWLTLAGIGLGGLYAFTRVAPTMIDAINLLDTIMQDATHMAISGAIMFGVLYVVWDAVRENGKLHHLIRLPYNMLINSLTRALFTIDPLSPLTTRIDQLNRDKTTFDKQFENLDGVIGTLQEQEQNYRGMAAKAQRTGVYAHSKPGNDMAEQLQAANFGAYTDAANQLAAKRARLEPVRAQFQQLSQVTSYTLQRLQVQRSIFETMWKTQQAVDSAVGAAGRILGQSRDQTWADAEQAEQIINAKFGDELGRLDHLKRAADPLIQSMNLETGAYSEEMLAGVQKATAALPPPTDDTHQALPDAASTNVTSFIRV